MITVRYGGKRGKSVPLAVSKDLMVVRTRDGRTVDRSVRTESDAAAFSGFHSVARFEDAGVEVFRVPGNGRDTSRSFRGSVREDGNVRFAGRALCDRVSGEPVVYTENFFVKFEDGIRATVAKRLLKEFGLKVKRSLPYAENAWFAEAPEGTGVAVFEIAKALLAHEKVELCHPELIRRAPPRAANVNQWHLKRTRVGGVTVDQHASVEAAWALSEGDGVVVAIIDSGIDIDHEEFAGAGKIVAPRDATGGSGNPRPVFTSEKHGTACAGVATANGQHQAAGVAPQARLMPIRLRSGLGSQNEADAFVWAADHGADVISCSWGPPDGEWSNPNDPAHNQVFALPDNTRLAIDHAVNNGRGGKGCVITWAAGNGNEPVDNDGYASYPKVIAIGASSDKGKRSLYSDTGNALWCVFPSSDGSPAAPLTPGIWTTDVTGSPGYSTSAYTDDFGGTSSSCPGAAGVAALVIARNPDLRWDEVKDIFKRACDRIDTAGGAYGGNGHSTQYGYGRLNAVTAVNLATPAPTYTAHHKAVQKVKVKDNATSRIKVEVGDTRVVKAARIHVDLEHTWIGDLVIKVVPPAAMGTGAITLHSRQGGGADNLKRVYDAVSTPALAGLNGQVPTGTWALTVADRASQDTGNILSFTVEVDL